MCEYQRIARQSQSAAPCQRKKAADVSRRSGREEAVPALREKHVWEEDTDPSAPVQLRGKKKAQQREEQKHRPQRQGVRRRRPQHLQEPGRQDEVQVLMEKLYIHAHTEPLDGAVPADVGVDTLLNEGVDTREDILDEETKERKGMLSDEEQQWLEEIHDNGLCGGWATLHRANPEKFTEIWTALARWNGEGNIAMHMNRYCKLREPEMGWERYLTALADSSVGIMRELEPDAGYKVLPDDVAEELPDFDIAKALASPDKTRTVAVEASGAGAEVYECIVRESFLKNKKGDPHIVHIETDHHHMSVRTRYIDRTVRIEEIVESEYAGVVVHPDRRRAEFVLEHGIYLDGGEDDVPQAQAVTLEFYNAVQKASRLRVES